MREMIPVRLLVFVIISSFIELTKGDCTSCPPIQLICLGNDGIYSYVMGTDSDGCSIITTYCTDDDGDSLGAMIMNDVSSLTISLSKRTFSCTHSILGCNSTVFRMEHGLF